MTQINTNLLFACCLSSFLLMLVSCRKHKETVYHLQGRLLISNTNPLPVPSYTLYFYQRSSPPGPSLVYASSSSATTTTDAQGNFKCDFTPAEVKGISLGGVNPFPVNLTGEGNSTFPYFTLGEIFLGNMGDIYLCKKIDTTIVAVDAQWGILPADTLKIDYYTINGPRQKLKTEMSVVTGALNVIIDTIYNAIFTNCDYKTKTFGYNIGIRQTTAIPLSFNIAYSTPWNSSPMPPGDEKKRVLNLR